MSSVGRGALVVGVAIALAGSACATATLSAAQQARVTRVIAEDLARYPELAGRSIEVGALDDDAVFFESSFTLTSALGDGPLSYQILANPRALGPDVDDDALRGVLAHELAHTLDYQTRTRQQLVELIGPALVPTSSTWEKRTDLIAVDRGFGQGLLRFRVWAFHDLAARGLRDELAEKRAVYYGALEIALLIDVKARCPRVFAHLLGMPPRDAHEIATHCP